jgi:hypothetical protein
MVASWVERKVGVMVDELVCVMVEYLVALMAVLLGDVMVVKKVTWKVDWLENLMVVQKDKMLVDK